MHSHFQHKTVSIAEVRYCTSHLPSQSLALLHLPTYNSQQISLEFWPLMFKVSSCNQQFVQRLLESNEYKMVNWNIRETLEEPINRVLMG